MSGSKQPEALRLAQSLERRTTSWAEKCFAAAELRRQHARIAELEAQLKAIGAGGVSGPLMGKPQEMPDLTTLTERGAKAWAGVDAQGLREGSASAGSEPVARVNDDGFIVEIGDLSIAPGQKLYLHPSPSEGMVGGWRPIETAPKDGTWIELWRTPTDFGRMSPFVIARWDGTESMFVWTEFCDPFTKYGRDKADAHIAQGDCYGSDDFTHWRALSAPPPPPTTSAGSGKGE